MPGWDHKISADVNELKQIVDGCHKVYKALGGYRRVLCQEEKEKIPAFRRSIVAAKSIPKGKIIENSLAGLVLQINGQEVHTRLVGAFNASNLLLVYGLAIGLGEAPMEVLRVISQLSHVAGRFEYVKSPKGITAIIDYAHTPDALENVLTTIAKLRKGNETVITVVGCGGDRDKTKRPIMAQVACDLSNKVFFTSDNPRSEDPNEIIKDMEEGLTSAAKRKYINIVDRKEAIKAAVSFAKSGDIILIAGKGHEKYQDIKGVKHDFDDKQVLANQFKELEK
jgi:UDP-N-acetylmuramoyl-L-alanyl-D-glutamate--2,6-diaminopimelate ligase